MALSEVSDEPTFSLATLPPTSGQRRLALAVVAGLLAAFGLAAPFATKSLPRIDAFIPSLEAIFFLSDFITSALLFSQFSIIRSRALLILANGYLFTGLIIIPHALSFPGAFAPTGLLGAGLQTTAWLYVFWHSGLPLAVLAYAWLKDDTRARYSGQASTRSIIAWSVVIIVCLICGLTWLVTAGDEYLPRIFLDRTRLAPFNYYIFTLNCLICVLALASLWVRGRSVLDLWLMVVVWALLTELVLTGILNSARFTLGFYTGRMFSLVTSTVVLIVLLAETTGLYAQLARSNRELRRERNNKLMNLEAMAASITHEVRQPLTAIVMNGGAALRFLGQVPPNNEEVRSNLSAIVRDGHRANQVFDNLRSLFGRADQGREPINLNEIALGVLRILQGELKDHNITTRTELLPELPQVLGHKGQIQEVILNLARNAIEAMDAVNDGNRVLRVRTERDDGDAITVAVQDTGPGIDPVKLEGIFEPFVTTKSKGMGLGLAICRTIIERHGGQLSAWSDKKNRGALFQFTLPIKSAAEATAIAI